MDRSLTSYVFLKYAKTTCVVHWNQQGNSKEGYEAGGESSWYCREVQMWEYRWTERLYDAWLLRLQCEQSLFV